MYRQAGELCGLVVVLVVVGTSMLIRSTRGQERYNSPVTRQVRCLEAQWSQLNLTPEQKAEIEEHLKRFSQLYSKLRQEIEAARSNMEHHVFTVLTDEQRQLVEQRQREAVSNMECILATLPYSGNENGLYTLPSSVVWRVKPFYRGIDEHGKQLIDPRLTLVLQDETRSFWPFIAKMDLLTAKKLHEDLGKTITLHEQEEPAFSSRQGRHWFIEPADTDPIITVTVLQGNN